VYAYIIYIRRSPEKPGIDVLAGIRNCETSPNSKASSGYTKRKRMLDFGPSAVLHFALEREGVLGHA
jgi:hypothetical protein